MRKNKKWIGLGLLATAATISAAYIATSKTLMKIALERDEPKFKGKSHTLLSGNDDFIKAFEKMTEASKELRKKTFETVEITGHDGVRLVGHYYAASHPKRLIIAMHGWRSSWSKDFGIASSFWHAQDCSVLYAEQRGQGESGGDYMGFGLLERYDCLDWVNWAHEKTKGELPLYLGGVSMGATTVLMTAGFDLPNTVCGIMADCGFTSPHAIFKHVIQNNLHLPYGPYKAAARDFYRKKMQITSDSYSCTDALKQCKVPVLFIHGTDDKFVPIEMTYENYRACASPKRLLIVPGAAHGMSYLVDTPLYQATVKQFWDETSLSFFDENNPRVS